MEQLRILDLTRKEAENNIEHMQLLRKDRHDKGPRIKRCKHCNEEHNKKRCKNKGSMQGGNTKQSMFYPNQRILWHLKQKKPGQGKFKIRWAGPYLIKKIYNNGTVDVTTLEHQELGRINMSKIKPYHEPETAAAYALQALACHNREELKKDEEVANTAETLLRLKANERDMHLTTDEGKTSLKFHHGQKVMRKEKNEWEGPFIVSRIHDRQVELVNLRGRKIKTPVELKDLKRYNEHNTHTRKEYKEKAKQTREERNLLSDKVQEDIEVHQVMMECYSVQVFKISIDKQSNEEKENEGALPMELTIMEEITVTPHDNFWEEYDQLVVKAENYEDKNSKEMTLYILKKILEWLILLNYNECVQEKSRLLEPPKES